MVDIDSDGDGLSDYDEGLIGTDPYNPDTDGDKFSDSGEMDQGKSPTDSNDFPNVDWFVLEGNKAPGEAKTDTRTYTIIKGQSRVIVVGTTSEEYPYFTSYESPYNDTLAWEVTPSAGVAITGDIDVNERNDDWDVDLIAGVELNGFSPVHIERVKVIQATTEDVTITVKLTATNISDGLLPSTIIVGLLPVSIEPDDGMIGVVGDRITSNKGESGERHFVTPKKSAEVSQDHVKLKVKGLDEAAWITTGNSNQLVEWVPATSQEAGDDSTKWKVQRNVTPDKYPVKIRTIAKYGNEEAAKLNVWVVWAEIASTTPYENVGFDKLPTSSRYGGNPFREHTWRFVFAIKPVALTSSTDDRPDLSGNKRTPVPGDGKAYFFDSSIMGDSARKKWDVSRQVENIILNPDLIPKAKFPNEPIYKNQPKTRDVVEPYPPSAAEGNDDPAEKDDENDDPYNATTSQGLTHAIGELSSADGPIFVIPNSAGVPAASFVNAANFREFVRLEISEGTPATGSTTWFRISDYKPWHHILASIYGSTDEGTTYFWGDSGSTFGEGVFEVPEEE